MKKVKLGDIADINSKTFQIDDFDEILYLDTSSVTRGVFDNFIHLSKNDIIPSRAKRAVKDKTIVYSTVRPNLQHFGIFEKPQKNVVVSTGFATIDVKSNLADPKYLYYNLTQDNYTNALHTIATNNVSSYPSINPSDLENLELEIHKDLPTQITIANVLSSLDDKIELNNKINNELENLAKTIYEYWFVQFNFPDAERNPYRSNGGKVIYNEEIKREIPKDWEIKKLNDFCTIFTGKKDVNQTVVNGKYKFFSCAPNPLLSNEYIYDGEAILVSGNGSYTGRVSYYNGKFDLYQRTYACVANNKDISIMPFLYFYMKFFFQPQYKGGTCGSAIPYIVMGDLLNFGIPYKSELLEKYSQIAKPILKQWFDNQQENTCLTQLRDFLLPLLMNGQVEVNHAN